VTPQADVSVELLKGWELQHQEHNCMVVRERRGGHVWSWVCLWKHCHEAHSEAQSKVRFDIWKMRASLNRNPNPILIHLARKNMIHRGKTNKITDNLFGM